MCPNGQVDWVAKLGNRAFRLRPSFFWSRDPANPRNGHSTTSKLFGIERISIAFVARECRVTLSKYREIVSKAKLTNKIEIKCFKKICKQSSNVWYNRSCCF